MVIVAVLIAVVLATDRLATPETAPLKTALPPPKASGPVTVSDLPPPASVSPKVMTEPVRVVSAPSVTASL